MKLGRNAQKIDRGGRKLFASRDISLEARQNSQVTQDWHSVDRKKIRTQFFRATTQKLGTFAIVSMTRQQWGCIFR